MALKKLPYKRLQHLIGLHLSTKEWPETQLAIDELSKAKRRGYLTKSEFIRVCRWKSPRAINHIKRNQVYTIRSVTKRAFATRSEQKKMELLIALNGVSVPMASAILTLTNPRRYGVIDIRVWQLLHKIGSVDGNPGGVAFDFKHWDQFLVIIRDFAGKYQVGARDIERTLFKVHGRFQKGTLYKPS